MSVSSVSLNTDVNVRYERLAAEYAKLRTQAKVLREGVLSERSKADKFCEEAKIKEIALRKLHSENESLIFRNEQLVKRVESMQLELEQSARSSKTNKEKAPKKTKDNRDLVDQIDHLNKRIILLEEELQNKLRQNEILIGQMNDMERIHNDEVSDISVKFSNEIRLLEEKLEKAEKDAKDRTNIIIEKPVETVKPFEKLSIPTCDVISSLSPSIPSNDEAALCIVQSIVSSLHHLSTFHHLLHQRTLMLPFDSTMESLPSHVRKLSAEYAACASMIASTASIVEQCVTNGQLDISSDLQRFCSSARIFTQHAISSLPALLIKMANEESKITWGTSRLEDLNNAWQSTLESSYHMMNNMLQILEDETIQMDVLCDELNKMNNICSDLLKIFTSRWELESRFPTCNKRVLCVGEAIKDCLQKLSIETARLSARLISLHRQKCSSPQASISVKEIEKSIANGNPFEDEELVEEENNTCVEINGKEDDFQSHESNESGEKIECNVEQSHLFKLQRIQLDQMKSRVIHLENEKEKSLVDLALLRKKLANLGGKDSVECDELEAVRSFRVHRFRELLDSVQYSECAAQYYKKECEVLLRKLKLGSEEKKLLLSKLELQTKEHIRMEDELRSVRRSYDEQLSALSEHVADLNMKLAEEASIPQPQTPIQKTGLKYLFK